MKPQTNSLVIKARRSHPFPYRTRKLSFSAPMVVGTRVPVRVGRCQALPLWGYYFAKNRCRPLGQAVKTPPFHGGNTGSSPVGVMAFDCQRVTGKDGFLADNQLIWSGSSVG